MEKFPDGYNTYFWCWYLQEYITDPCSNHPQCHNKDKELILEIVQ